MAFKLVLRGSDYFLTIMDSAVVMYIMVFDFFPLQCLNQVDLLEGALICGLRSKENVVFFPIQIPEIQMMPLRPLRTPSEK